MDTLDLRSTLTQITDVFTSSKEPSVPAAPFQAPAQSLGAGRTGEEELYTETKALQEEDITSLVARGFRTVNALRSVFDYTVRKSSFEPEEGFDVKAHWTELTQGIPSIYHEKFSRAESLAEAWDIHAGIQKELDDLRVLGENGVSGVTAMLLSSVVDVDAVLPFLGKAASARKVASTALAVKGADVAKLGTVAEGAEDVSKAASIWEGVKLGTKSALVTEPLLAATGDTAQWSDVPAGILMAGAFGGAIRASAGLPVGLSTRELPTGNAAKAFLDHVRDPEFTRRLDNSIDDVLNEYTGDGVFGGELDLGNMKTRAQALVDKVKTSSALQSGWLKSARDALKKGPFADDFTRLWESGSATARALAVSLFESAEGFVINNKSGAIIAEDIINKGYKRFAAERDAIIADGWKSRGFTLADWRQRAQYERDLNRRVMEYANEMRLGRTVSPEPDAKLMLDAIKRNADYILYEAQGGKAGARVVPGFADIKPQAAHIPLVWSGEAMQAAIVKLGKGKIGRERLQSALSQAYQRALPDIDPDVAWTIAGALMNRQLTKSAGMDMNLGYLLSDDGKAFLKESMKLNGLTDDQADAVLNRLTVAEGDKGKIAYARRRTDIDLAGEYEGIRIIDLVEQDLNKVMFQYNDSMSKRIALTRHGIDNKSKMETIKNQVLDEIQQAAEESGKVIPKEDMEAYKRFLTYVFEYFEAGSVNKHINPWMRRAKQMTNLSLLSKLGLTQVAETAGILATAGFKSFIASSELMRSLFKDPGGINIRQVSEDLGWCVGNLGYEKGLMRSDMVADAALDMVTAAPSVTRTIDDLLAKGQHVQSVLSGYTRVLEGQLRLGALSVTDKIFRSIKDGSDISALLRTAGIDTETYRALKKLVDSGTIEFNEFGHVDRMNPERWNPELREDYGRALLRVSYTMTQRALPGESMQWLHAPSTAIFGHLQSFPLLAMRKQFLRTFARGDGSAQALIAYGMGTACIASMVRATVEGQELDVETLAKRSFALNNSLSWAATGIDLTATILGIDEIAPGGRYAGEISLPMLGVAQDALHLPGAIASMLPGMEFDRQDKRALHVIPVFGRMYGTGMLFEQFVNTD